MFRLGLVINPLAGIGGPLGLKGSDGDAGARAIAGGAPPRSAARVQRALARLTDYADRLRIYGYRGEMGEAAVTGSGFAFHAVGQSRSEPTTAEDTVAAARALRKCGVDLLLFAGGDGTARDICRALGDSLPVLGLPCGVKMHSGVYAVSPEAAADIVAALLNGELVDIGLEEVRDIDEDAFRQGRVSSRHYGELRVPRLGQFLQQTKQAGREVESLAVAEIAAEVVENLEPGTLYLIGPGSTTAAIMEALGLDNTLLGVDAVKDGELLGSDLDEAALCRLLDAHPGPSTIIVTAIGGQGHILGRGNQQFSPEVLRRVGADRLLVVASKGKISGLAGRPLLVDSNDPALDRELEGYIRVVTGYRDAILYRVSAGTV